MDSVEKITKVVIPFAEELELDIVDVEYLQDGGYWFVRIYIENKNGADVDLDECEKLSRSVDGLIDGIIDEKFFLEISSPGLERPLKKESDYVRFKGKRASIKLKKKMDELNKIEGIIEDYKDGILTLETEGDIISIPYSNIRKANLVFDFNDF
ncbi:MAG: ribosome maturation factor RimP [Fusobacteria bacterium]|nr:ribosome maturation factor RimP [Fusobacteriota bacterium]